MVLKNGLYGSTDHEILLFDTQGLTLIVVIFRVQNLGQHLSVSLLLHRPKVRPLIEQFHVHVIRRFRLPQTKGVHGFAVITGNQHIVGDSPYDIRVFNGYLKSVIRPLLFDLTAEFNFDRFILFSDQPASSGIQPAVGQFDLLSLDDALFEQPVFIQDAETGSRKTLRGGCIHIAGCQTAQAAVS